MASEIREWSVPAPARALLWWPAISFVLVVVAPDAATGVIILAGAVLALLGVALPALARRLRPPRGRARRPWSSRRWRCRPPAGTTPPEPCITDGRTSDSWMSY